MDNSSIKKIIKKYIQFLIKKGYHISDAFLFGSVVKNRTTRDSDIDVAIIIKNRNETYDALFEIMKYRRQFDTRIEPHIFLKTDFNKENPLANEILKNGIKIS